MSLTPPAPAELVARWGSLPTGSLALLTGGRGAGKTRWCEAVARAAREAGLAVREGLNEETAFRAITKNAAEIVGIADRVGTLEVGKDADIAVFDGHPFDFRTHCVLTLINGAIVHDSRKQEA